MTLQDIFDQLAVGELAQLYTGIDSGIARIEDDAKPALLMHIQLGLTELHKRFLLREGTLTIGLIEGRQSYVIDKNYALTNTKSNEPQKFILDTDSPYKSDLMRIERIYDDEGVELSLNIIGDPDSIRTPSFRSLIVPDTIVTKNLKVIYRADHPEIDKVRGAAVAFKTEIDFPMSHMQPLLYFVASRKFNPMGSGGEFHEGNNYAMKYEQACLELERLNMYVDTGYASTHFERNGFV
jgi:hypothetical protein